MKFSLTVLIIAISTIAIKGFNLSTIKAYERLNKVTKQESLENLSRIVSKYIPPNTDEISIELNKQPLYIPIEHGGEVILPIGTIFEVNDTDSSVSYSAAFNPTTFSYLDATEDNTSQRLYGSYTLKINKIDPKLIVNSSNKTLGLMYTHTKTGIVYRGGGV